MNTISQPKEEHYTVDFGCGIEPDAPHFAVLIPRKGLVHISEFFADGSCIERARLTRVAWGEIAVFLAANFNERLKQRGRAGGRWRIGVTRIDPSFGKELCVLAWAIEGVSIAFVVPAIVNWKKLKPEDRAWLFTTTAAACGHVDDVHLGWRKALRYALTETPVR